jgi:outer membrane protein assembly factor BamB
MNKYKYLLIAGAAAVGVGTYAYTNLSVGDSSSLQAGGMIQESAVKPDDHTMFGNGPSRNFANLSTEAKLSHEFPTAEGDDATHVLGKRVKWKETLGSRAYGGPTVGSGRVLVGTNNENPRNKRDRGKATEDDPMGPPIDKGIMMCFEEGSGKFLWQLVCDKLESGQVNDWPREGICSSPIIEGNRAYIATNRCEIVCVSLDGLGKGNVGQNDEKKKDPIDADVVWTFDMMKEAKVFPHNMTACSPLIVGDLIFITTANGVDENHINIPFPEAPSFLCLNKQTGKLLWKSNLPGRDIMHGQWSNPSYGVVKGKGQVFFPGGDGWIYALDPETGKVIWKFDANPKDSKYELGGKGTRSDFIGTPVVLGDRVYIGTGQDPEHFEGIGHFWCIDATKQGDISPDLVEDAKVDPPTTKPNPNSGAIWHYGGNETHTYAKRDYVFGRTMSTACIVDDVIYISELAGYLHCIDLKTGKKYWQWDTKSAIWGSPYYIDGKVLLANEDGDVYFFKHEKTHEVMDEVDVGSKAGVEAQTKAKAEGKSDAMVKKAARDAQDKAIAAIRAKVKEKYLLQKVEVAEPIRSTPVVANDTLYIMTEKTLFAVSTK